VHWNTSFQLLMGRTHYGTGYFVWHRVAAGANVSRPCDGIRKPWDPTVDVLARDPGAAAAVAVLDAAGTGDEVLPRNGSSFVPVSGKVALTANATAPILDVSTSVPAAVRAIELNVSAAAADWMGSVRIQFIWDGGKASSSAPLALFFGAGSLNATAPRVSRA
jgi:hypothetical protein